jgi:ABC-type sugar transport system ATPase subunit
VALTSARDAMAAGIALVPEDRQRLGLHFNLSISDNIALPRAARDGLGRIRRRAERTIAEDAIRNLAIRSAHPDRTPDTLSGGNQQKTATARWLAVEPRILLLDEPTRGVDVGAKFEIHNLIRDRARDGMACVVVSSDLPEVLALADRIVVMREGRIRGELSGVTATEESVMQLATHEVEATA